MTPYEALELRYYYRNETAAAFRYWVSLTFAVLVAAYVAGDQLNGWTVGIILVLYIMVTWSNNRILLTSSADIQALSEEIELMIEDETINSPALNGTLEGIVGLKSFMIVAYILRGTLFIGTIFYVLHRAGYVG